MFEELNTGISGTIGDYFKNLGNSPLNVIAFIIDITVVIVLIYYFIKFAKETKSMAIDKRNSIFNYNNFSKWIVSIKNFELFINISYDIWSNCIVNYFSARTKKRT